MKKNNILLWGLSLFLAVISLSSCLKDKGWEDGKYGSVRNTEGEMYVSLGTSGLNNVTKSSISINTVSPDNDTVDLYVSFDYQQKATSDVTVTLAIDDAKRLAYNTANEKNYQPVTSDMVKILNSSLTIPAGEHGAYTQVIIKQNSFAPDKSYMFPVSITEVAPASVQLSSNINTRYFNIIGNPLAGAYLQSFYRWNGTTDTTTAPNSSVFENEPVSIFPENETTLLLPEDYLQTFVGASAGISLSFTNTNGVFTNFSVALNDATKKGLAEGGFTIVTPPKLAGYGIVGDANTGYKGSWFRTYMVLLNSAGGTRTVIDHFVKQ